MAEEGASPSELVVEACRRNNTNLLEETIRAVKPTATASTHEAAVAELLNSTRDGTGSTPLHVAASAGSYEVLDLLLDQPGLETDPLDRVEGDTPLHRAVLYCNKFPSSSPSSIYPATTSDTSDVAAFLAANEGHPIVEILVDAGCDPRRRNRARRRPVELVDPRNEPLRDFLRRAEFALVEGEDGIVEADDNEDENARNGPGSASDSE